MTNPHHSESHMKRSFLLELAKKSGSDDKLIYERIVFSYTEKEEAAAETMVETLTGSRNDVSIWGDFYFNRSNMLIPPITDLTAEPSDKTLVVE